MLEQLKDKAGSQRVVEMERQLRATAHELDLHLLRDVHDSLAADYSTLGPSCRRTLLRLVLHGARS